LTTLHVFFFFQAEDGIRDGHVTGVQTCALPISGYPPGAHSTQESEPVERSPRLRKLRVFPVPRNMHPDGAIFMDAHFKIARKGRSEERRVGKECRCGCGGYRKKV